ncbi:alpha-xylosidase [Niveibacterium sp.]|uniref:glycoside hydrolase family 31 protein n=1 Tax=Niveibacterium sp. TaxID=2017444 RepID=UPI0035B2A468
MNHRVGAGVYDLLDDPQQPREHLRHLSTAVDGGFSAAGENRFLADGEVPIALTAHRLANAGTVFRLRFGTATRPDYGLLPGLTAVEPLPLATTGDAWTLAAGDVSLTLHRAPLRITVARRGEALLSSIFDVLLDEHLLGWARLPALAAGKDRWLASFELGADEPVYGLGEKFGALNRRGQLIVGRNEDALGVNAEQSYKNVPFAWSPRGWGLLVHTPAPVTHGVGYAPWSHRGYVVDVPDETLDLFFFVADTPAEILRDYAALTGAAASVPLWSLGTWVSRAYYRTPEEALDVAREWRRRELPGDVLTLDGRACWEVAKRFSFQWDETRFPDPAAALGALKAEGFRLCVWEYPLLSVQGPLFNDFAARGWLLKDQSGKAYEYHWPGTELVGPLAARRGKSPFGPVLTPLPTSGILDFTQPEAYAWWRDAHKALFDIGVDTLKVDFGEQVPDDAVASNGDSGQRLHNVYALLYQRCVFEASEKFRPGDAVLWGRPGFIGSQRYPVQWGGDPQSDWGGLAGSVRGMLSYGLSGVPYYSSDIGGFYGAQPTAELYLRWVAQGVFSSHCRFHGIGPREPWYLGEEVSALTRQWLQFRYRLIPYIAGAVEESIATGLPVARAMALAFPDDTVARHFDLQYLFGPALLVRPLVEAGGRAEVWLPKGSRWFDLWSDAEYEGGQLIEVEAGLDRIPAFGREGHVLPLGPALQRTDEIDRAQPLDELWLFGKPAVAPRVLGDGVSLAAPGVLQLRSDARLTLRGWGTRWQQIGTRVRAVGEAGA